MAAKIIYQSRGELGMISPKSRSTNITPQNGGVAVHWGGPKQNLTSSHAGCIAIWKQWQRFHMGRERNWVDIAYTAAFCNHGYVLAGRGYFTRTAANGTNEGNQNYYAFVWIGGSGNTITSAAFDALNWLVNDARKNGRAGTRVRGHQDFTGSQCGGPTLNTRAKMLDRQPVRVSTPIVVTPPPAPKPVDPWEVFMSELNSTARKNLSNFGSTFGEPKQKRLDKLASLPTPTLDRLVELAEALAAEDGVDHGGSFVGQFLKFNREERPELKSLIDAVKKMDSNLGSFGEHGIAILRELSARGLRTVAPKKVRKNKAYTKRELGIT